MNLCPLRAHTKHKKIDIDDGVWLNLWCYVGQIWHCHLQNRWWQPQKETWHSILQKGAFFGCKQMLIWVKIRSIHQVQSTKQRWATTTTASLLCLNHHHSLREGLIGTVPQRCSWDPSVSSTLVLWCQSVINKEPVASYYVSCWHEAHVVNAIVNTLLSWCVVSCLCLCFIFCRNRQRIHHLSSSTKKDSLWKEARHQIKWVD